MERTYGTFLIINSFYESLNAMRFNFSLSFSKWFVIVSGIDIAAFSRNETMANNFAVNSGNRSVCLTLHYESCNQIIILMDVDVIMKTELTN